MFITLTTDFGTRQGSQSVMHGVIYRIAPQAVITDLTHHITPFKILEAGFVLAINAFYFPENTVHVAVVDPGVGTRRRPIAAQVGSQRFIAPDNGLLSWVYALAEKKHWPMQIVHLDNPQYWLPNVSRTFHGRDVFAPAAAHLAAGVPLEALGAPIDDAQRLELPSAKPIPNGVEGEVIYIDEFGSAICSILPEDLAGLGEVQVSLCGATIPSMVNTFGDRQLYGGELIALWDSSGYLYVSENNGTGGTIIQPKPGDRLVVTRRPA
ncbi:MAG: S-adenosyl-l-methionine hydroxide adenosyltransferase family protein [Chloroflexota bacterium]